MRNFCSIAVTAFILSVVGTTNHSAAAEKSPKQPIASESTSTADAAAGRGDYFTAQVLYRELAKKGNARAQYRLGFLLSSDNPAEARSWYSLAAEQGHTEAQFRLGVMLSEGRGGPVDAPEAKKWLERAAADGNLEAKYRLGVVSRPAAPAVSRGPYGSDPERCKYLQQVYFRCRDRNGETQCKAEDDARWACAAR